MLANMNQSVDPCEDFYSFSCGGWIQQNSIQAGRSEISIRSKIHYENIDRLEAVLTNPIARPHERSYERKLKTFYRSCLDGFGREIDGGKHIVDLITGKLGGWYVFDDTVVDSWDITDGMAAIHGDLNVPSVLFRMYVGPSVYEKGKHSIRVTLDLHILHLTEKK